MDSIVFEKIVEYDKGNNNHEEKKENRIIHNMDKNKNKIIHKEKELIWKIIALFIKVDVHPYAKSVQNKKTCSLLIYQTNVKENNNFHFGDIFHCNDLEYNNIDKKDTNNKINNLSIQQKLNLYYYYYCSLKK